MLRSCRFYLGIDVAKAKLDCLLLDMSNAKRKSKSIANSPDGVAALLSWLNKQEVAIQDVQVIMEPTGVYHERALFALAQAGLAVSLVNPAQLRKFARHWRQNQDRCRRQRRTRALWCRQSSPCLAAAIGVCTRTPCFACSP